MMIGKIGKQIPLDKCSMRGEQQYFGICRTLNVCGSRYLDRRGDHETSKGLSFFRP